MAHPHYFYLTPPLSPLRLYPPAVAAAPAPKRNNLFLIVDDLTVLISMLLAPLPIALVSSNNISLLHPRPE
jgi:hypothetical protein